jgi:hypothetical protein
MYKYGDKKQMLEVQREVNWNFYQVVFSFRHFMDELGHRKLLFFILSIQQ